MPAPIASTEHTCRTSSGKVFELVIQVEAPVPADRCWSCTVALSGLDPKPHVICAEDSLQALTLAVDLIRLRLEDFVRKGGCFWDSDTSQALPAASFISSYFPGRTLS